MHLALAILVFSLLHVSECECRGGGRGGGGRGGGRSGGRGGVRGGLRGGGGGYYYGVGGGGRSLDLLWLWILIAIFLLCIMLYCCIKFWPSHEEEKQDGDTTEEAETSQPAEPADQAQQLEAAVQHSVQPSLPYTVRPHTDIIPDQPQLQSPPPPYDPNLTWIPPACQNETKDKYIDSFTD